MNYGKIVRDVAVELRETLSASSAALDPLNLERYPLEATDEVAERTDCLYGTWTQSLVAGQAEYTFAPPLHPEFYRVKALWVKDSAGHYRPLTVIEGGPGEMDRITGGLWRDVPRGDPPSHAVFLGVASLRLYQVPSLDRAGGLGMEGFYKPGDTWAYDPDTGAPLPIDPSHECPLPSWAHRAVYLCARLKRAMTDERKSVAQRIPFYVQEYERALGDVAMNASLHHQRVASRRGAVAPFWRR